MLNHQQLPPPRTSAIIQVIQQMPRLVSIKIMYMLFGAMLPQEMGTYTLREVWIMEPALEVQRTSAIIQVIQQMPRLVSIKIMYMLFGAMLPQEMGTYTLREVWIMEPALEVQRTSAIIQVIQQMPRLVSIKIMYMLFGAMLPQ